MKDYFKYRFSSEFDFNLDEGDFVTVVGNNNDLIIYTLLHGHKKCNIFVKLRKRYWNWVIIIVY